ncbi:hypothetical protein FisN_3Lh477 [Fistulifera solaris]|uniref:Uncharacterized protein n=1 Tax=Fistulifera solaris TaxID=1519565 RepID=A0A1Z5J8G3_FISSO|nr:hypothetical protein FisN_3Lh477 [Fistulifera solaris]|eukprot:GAX10275.1 hypothetical protein FisN_3Lh477 [Fistulifera solaris]
MVFSVISASISRILVTFSQSVLVVSLLLTIVFAMGWIHRLLWYLVESEISKALNDTPVTIGNLQFDVLRGQLWCSNLVVHAPRRDQFHWDSPLLVRVGRLYVQGNFVQCLFSNLMLREELPIDLYTIAASDIQVFIERRHNFFNFFLCDKHVVIPDNIIIEENNSHHEDSINEEESTTMNETRTDPTEEKAQMLMEDMLRAIRQAAQEGSIKGALVEQRQKLTDQLKALQQVTKKSVAMKEGAEIVQHMSEAVRKKTQIVQKVVQPTRNQESLPKKKNKKNEKTKDLIRIARMQIKDLRIFTHEHFPKRQWSRPIQIPKVDVRSSELCPPLSAKDEHDLPALYQPVDQCLEVLWRRLVTEGAKTNSGNLFKTAMREVLDYYWAENHPVED